MRWRCKGNKECDTERCEIRHVARSIHVFLLESCRRSYSLTKAAPTENRAWKSLQAIIGAQQLCQSGRAYRRIAGETSPGSQLWCLRKQVTRNRKELLRFANATEMLSLLLTKGIVRSSFLWFWRKLYPLWWRWLAAQVRSSDLDIGKEIEGVVTTKKRQQLRDFETFSRVTRAVIGWRKLLTVFACSRLKGWLN